MNRRNKFGTLAVGHHGNPGAGLRRRAVGSAAESQTGEARAGLMNKYGVICGS